MSSNASGVPTASIDDVGAEPIRELANDGHRVLTFGVHRDVGAEALRGVEAVVGEIDRDDVARAVEPGADDRGQADRAGTDDRDDVARCDLPLSTPTS